MAIADELQKLNELRQSGVLSEQEFQQAKDSLLRQQNQPPAPQPGVGYASSPTTNVNQWCMFIHLSQLCGFVVPFAGLVVPIVLWQMKKNESPVIDKHGKIVVNWMITSLIYWVISFVLMFVVIGVFLMLALVAVCVVFAIIGGLKAQNGEFWPYPGTIVKFFPTD